MIETPLFQLNKGIEKMYSKLTKSLDSGLLTGQVVVETDTFGRILYKHQNEFDFRKFGDDELFVLTILSWYLPEWIAILLQEQLRESWTTEKSELKSAMLSSKEMMLSTLQIQEYYNGNDLFGNLLRVNGKVLKNIALNLRFMPNPVGRVKKPTRRRGYNDHGSRRPDHQPEPRYKDYKDLLSYNQWEEERLNRFSIQQRWVDRALRNLEAV